jgi:capsular polysaccharide biosynthesis protein
LFLGGGIVALLEAKDQSFRTETDVVAALKLPVLVSLPTIEEAAADQARSKKKVYAGV